MIASQTIAKSILPVAVALLVCACSTAPSAPADVNTRRDGPVATSDSPGGKGGQPDQVLAMTFGKGTIGVSGGTAVNFIFDAELRMRDAASGYFRYDGELDDGTIDIAGEVRCVALDSSLGRAWIGGQVTTNRSAGSARAAALSVGSAVGFVVQDSSQTKRASLGIPQSLGAGDAWRAYCSGRNWPSGGLHPVRAGTLGVFP